MICLHDYQCFIFRGRVDLITQALVGMLVLSVCVCVCVWTSAFDFQDSIAFHLHWENSLSSLPQSCLMEASGQRRNSDLKPIESVTASPKTAVT